MLLLKLILLLDIIGVHVVTAFQNIIPFNLDSTTMMTIQSRKAGVCIVSSTKTRLRVASSSGGTSTTTATTTLTNADNKRPTFVPGPPVETKPDYENIHGPLGKTLDKVFLKLFRAKLSENIGVDSKLPNDDYQGIMELTTALNSRYSDRKQVQTIAQNTLRDMFPSWLPKQYAILFSKAIS